MIEDQAHERRSIIAKIRAERKSHINPEYFKVECKIQPCCKTCEFFFSSGKCAGGMKNDPSHAYGHIVTDENDLCLGWSSSYDAYCDALAKIKEN